MVVQLDEVEYPSGLKKIQKFRTEIDINTDFPQFLKNFFEFKIFSLTNRIVMRFGLFILNSQIENGGEFSFKNDDMNIPPRILFKNSQLIGSNELIFTPSINELLRKHKWADNHSPLFDPENEGNESGYIYFKLSLKSISLDCKIYEDNKEIEECFYDPFQKDPEIIRDKLQQTVVLNEEKQFKLNKMIKKLENTNNQYKTLAVEKHKVTSEIKLLEDENNLLRKNMARIQNYDEIHIEVDLLSQSKQGVEILEKKYAILLSQISLQSEYKYELEKNYEEIDPNLSKLKIVKDKLNKLKVANEELKFNIKRQEDMLPLITAYEEKIKNNEKLINNFKENIELQVKKNEQELINNNAGYTKEDLEEKIAALYQERKILEEKHIQMNLYQTIFSEDRMKFTDTHEYNQENSENIEDKAYSNFLRVTGSGMDTIMNQIIQDSERSLIDNYKKRILDLNNDLSILTEKLERIDQREKIQKESHILIDPSIKFKKEEMRMKMHMVENREKALLAELDSSEQYYVYSIKKMRLRLEELDKIIEKEFQLSKNSEYFQ